MYWIQDVPVSKTDVVPLGRQVIVRQLQCLGVSVVMDEAQAAREVLRGAPSPDGERCQGGLRTPARLILLKQHFLPCFNYNWPPITFAPSGAFCIGLNTSPQSSYVETLTLNVILLGGGAFGR